MNSTPSSTEPEAPATVPPIEPEIRSRGERWLIAGVVIVVVGMVLVAFGQTIGRDIWNVVRRLPIFRPVAHPQKVAVTPKEPDSPVETTVTEQRRPRSCAADALITPPRKRIPVDPRATKPREDEMNPAADRDGKAVDNEVASLPVMEKRDPVADGSATAGASAPMNSDSDLTASLLETAAQLVSLSWQGYEYPSRMAASDTSKTRMIYNNHRNRLLKAVAHPHPTSLSLELFRKDYAGAIAQFPDDPRLDYAFGLVLWKHGRQTEAIEMFQTAERLNDVPFLPAALAVAWGRFLIHEDRRGLDQLAYVAKLLAAPGDKYPTASQKEQAAASIGRALGYLSGPGSRPELAEVVDLTSRNIFGRLPEHLRQAFEQGRDQIGSRQSELLQLAALPGDRLQSDHLRQQQELQTQIDSLRGEMRDARNVLSRDHQSHVDNIKQILKDVVDVRGKTDKLRPMLEQMRDKIFDLSRPPTTLPGNNNTNSTNGNPGQIRSFAGSTTTQGQGQPGQNPANQQNPALNNMLLPESATERAARVSQLNKARDELKKINSDLANLREQQKKLVADRHEADAEQKLNVDEARKQRVTRIQEQRALEQKLQTLNKALRRTMDLREGVETIAAYVPWNIEVEAEALWQALTTKPTARTP